VSPRFTPQAREQFLAALAYIAADDRIAAAALLLRVERTLQRLARFPYSGRRIPEFPRESAREVVIRPYRFFYEIASDGVWISAVWHSAQQPATPRSGGTPYGT
jgi:plasmid stabilization system protein ParE